MKLSLSICTHNHLPALQQTLAGLQGLLRPEGPWELLIVDNASTDGTGAWLAQGGWQRLDIGCRVVQEIRLGVAHARNRALVEAKGEYVVFLDDDETPEPDWLVNLERVIDAHQPAAIGGRIRAHLPGGRPDWLTDELLGFLGELDYGPVERALTGASTPIFTGNAVFHRQTVLDVGGFDGNLGRRGNIQSGGEDTELYRRLVKLKKPVYWAPRAVIHHRIESWKLRRSYFLQLHYRQGRMESVRKRGPGSRIPPLYLLPQLTRAYWRALALRLQQGASHSLRMEMNAAYFTGYLIGWMRDTA
ncbi:MAG: glycosyl transferase family 2 [Nitrosomonadales bacterium]|nr:MAG: glycosyl transferase family 2 [Nitrosomonadales bacterium]